MRRCVALHGVLSQCFVFNGSPMKGDMETSDNDCHKSTECFVGSPRTPKLLKCHIKGKEATKCTNSPNKNYKFRSPSKLILKEEVQEDYFNDTIAASPEGDITFIPESPTSEVFPENEEVTADQVREQLGMKFIHRK